MKKIPFDSNTILELTPEQIEDFKKEFKAVFHITSGDKECWIHNPSRQILDLANASSSKKTSMFNEVILKNCWLAGDKDIVMDDYYFMGVASALGEVIQFADATIKKL